MNFTLKVALSFCIIIPAIVGVIRFRKIDSVYRPFIYCIWIGLCNEVISYLIARKGHSTAINGNIYMLIESLLLIWQFKRWKLFGSRRILVNSIIIGVCIAWIVENVVVAQIRHFDSYFLILYSCLLCFMSISLINRLIDTERDSLLKNSEFIICIAFIIYYAFSAMAEAFWIYGLAENKSFRLHITNISVISNLVANLMYSFAILWMPIKRRFTLPSL